VGAEDAEFLERELSPEFVAHDLVNLAKYNIYLKLMIDGVAGRPFSARTLSPFPAPEKSSREKIIKVSREKYGTPIKKVEDDIRKWTGFSELPAQIIKNDSKKEIVLYDAKCSICDKDTKVIFPPDGKRPIYCRTCLKKEREKKEINTSGQNQNVAARSPNQIFLDEPLQEKTISFAISKKSREDMEREKRKRKTVDLDGLKKALKESLNNDSEQKRE
jgi:CxxC-x17-CxxC domain-containing protein